MNNPSNATRLAQSASALGAGILGFGLGAKWGNIISSYAVIIIVAGAVFHIWGMYVIQMKNQSKSMEVTVRILWLSAWICLVALLGIVGYLLITNKKLVRNGACTRQSS
jgi:hypothetical protein